MRIAGVNILGSHDAAACLVENGQLISLIEEERLIRKKHAPGALPVRALQYCLSSAGLNLADIDYIALPFMLYGTPFSGEEANEESIFGVRYADSPAEDTKLARFLNSVEPGTKAAPKVAYVSHHLAHAASAYRCSPFDETTLLVADGEGDLVSTSLSHAKNDHIKLLKHFPVAASLGMFYTASAAFLGMGDGGEGKVMGLAPYGTPVFNFDEQLSTTSSGYRVNLPVDTTVSEQGAATFRAWLRQFANLSGMPNRRRFEFDPILVNSVERTEWGADHTNLASSAQAALERILLHLAGVGIASSGCPDLAVAGGVFLNCSVNGVLNFASGIRGFFAQPLANDVGAVLGAALEATFRLGGPPRVTLDDVDLGPSFNEDTIIEELDRYGVRYDLCPDIPDTVAELLARNQVVGWFQGRMEAGPRALGRRSILASPGSVLVRDRVNHVKRRALWRPLSPSVREEEARSLLSGLTIAPFMIVRDMVRPEAAAEIAGAVHVDQSVRPQIVRRATNEMFWELIGSFRKKNGAPCVINTSFNDDNEPIVCTPRDALRTFYTTELDALAMGPALITKNRG